METMRQMIYACQTEKTRACRLATTVWLTGYMCAALKTVRDHALHRHGKNSSPCWPRPRSNHEARHVEFLRPSSSTFLVVLATCYKLLVQRCIYRIYDTASFFYNCTSHCVTTTSISSPSLFPLHSRGTVTPVSKVHEYINSTLTRSPSALRVSQSACLPLFVLK